MKNEHLIFYNVSFAYASSSPLFEGFTFDCGPGWTGIVGENGSGKTTLLGLAGGLLAPSGGSIGRPAGPAPVYCPQRTDRLTGPVAEFLAAVDSSACRLRGLLGIEPAWGARWDTLSHGERKKAQAAAALWPRPVLLAVDEPFNHLDREARARLARALAEFSGVGLLVTHDRALLDELCRQCLFLHPPRAVMRPGGFSRGLEQEKNEAEHALKRREQLKDEYRKVKKERERRRDLREKKQSRTARKKAAGGDHDARFKINAARLSGKDVTAGRLARQLDGRLRQAEEEYEGAAAVKTYDSGVWVAGEVAKRDFLFTLEAGELSFGDEAGRAGGRLIHPLLSMKRSDRVALTGPNGVGKSTLVRRIMAGLALPADRVIYLPQEIPLEESRRVLDEILSLSSDEQGLILSLVSRLGSRPPRLLATGEPSPGEARKLLLALGILRRPHLIVMDEPTNHLDAVAVQSLSDALHGCPGGLLLVSHDRRFLEELTTISWEIGRGEKEGDFVLSVL